jgi:hypothetical protein
MASTCDFATNDLGMAESIKAIALTMSQHRARADSALRLAHLSQFMIFSTCLVLLEENVCERSHVVEIVKSLTVARSGGTTPVWRC